MITKQSTANHEEWLALRHKYIGGSDAAAVVGLNAYVSPYTLWAEKTGRLPGFEGNLATEVGTYLEEFVAQKFASETGKKVRKSNQSWFNDEYPWAIANIDREIVGEDAGLEIKTTTELNLSKFKGGEYPANYYVQIVHYLAVTGKQRWYLAVLIGNKEFKWFTIERDEDEIKALMEAEREFKQFVDGDTPPIADGASSTADTLGKLYPNSTDTTIGIGSYEKDLDDYFRLKDQLENIGKTIDGIVNRLKAHLQECERGEGEKYKVSWKTQSKTLFDHKKFVADHPEMDVSKYYKTSNSRPFKVTEKKG
ncbi:MAG: YqaJ viral recombinase family protein [Bacteroidales bacterium]|nr:YqaJ viral recombinase family protein [Bacteroidales bacterium]